MLYEIKKPAAGENYRNFYPKSSNDVRIHFNTIHDPSNKFPNIENLIVLSIPNNYDKKFLKQIYNCYINEEYFIIKSKPEYILETSEIISNDIKDNDFIYYKTKITSHIKNWNIFGLGYDIYKWLINNPNENKKIELLLQVKQMKIVNRKSKIDDLLR